MKAEKMIQPQQHGATTRGAGAEEYMVAARAAHPVVEANKGLTLLTADARRQMIEQAAYFRAQSRGFAGGCPEQDWYEAEAEIDSMLSGAD